MTLRGTAKALGIALLAPVIALSLLWSALAIHYSNLPWPAVRTAAAIAYAALVLAAFAVLPRRGRTALWFFASVACVVVWWSTIAPSNARDWEPQVAVLPQPIFDGDRVAIRNVRDFEYRTEADFMPRYADRTYDLSRLTSMDLVMSYWEGNRDIAHVIFSFAFADGQRIAVSVETRPEKGEVYSPLGGVFKQFELIYVIADERDVVELRTNFREEGVYLYPMRFPPATVRSILERLLHEAADLVEHPVFYGGLARNCTTTWILIAEKVTGKPVPFDLRLLLNGRFDELLYERGHLVADASNGLPYEEMRKLHCITEIAQQYKGDPEFSTKVRSHLPAHER
jgi:hypothetical protein